MLPINSAQWHAPSGATVGFNHANAPSYPLSIGKVLALLNIS